MSNVKASANSKFFSKIYANNVWGTLDDPDEKFCSGTGSHNDAIIVPYMNTLIQLLRNNNLRNIVDLGCGDFWIMRHVLEVLSKNGYNFFYTGIDVVENLTDYNNKRFGRDNVKFVCADAAVDEEPLPDGDILIVRQVFQHLSNADIKKILDKASKFKFLFVTEHICDAPDAVHNIDTPADAIVRLRYNSGIYLEHAPFNYKNIVHLLKVPQYGGIIRSSLIIN